MIFQKPHSCFPRCISSSLVQLPCLIANTKFLNYNYFNAKLAAQGSDEWDKESLAKFQNYQKMWKWRNLIKEIKSLLLGKWSMQSRNGNLRTHAWVQILHLIWSYENNFTCILFAYMGSCSQRQGELFIRFKISFGHQTLFNWWWSSYLLFPMSTLVLRCKTKHM